MNAQRSTIIVLLSHCLATGSGCQLLPIPSYRADQAGLVDDYGGHVDGFEGGYGDEDYCDNECPPGWPVIPMPRWYAKWREKESLPEGPDFPRFHPLPTRPMFSPRPGDRNAYPNGMGMDNMGAAQFGPPTYGSLPSSSEWQSQPMEWVEPSSNEPYRESGETEPGPVEVLPTPAPQPPFDA